MPSSRGTILVVDDELDIREMLEVGLEAAGYETLLADHGERAIELFKAHRADLVICDMKMPGLSGVDTIRRLREQDPELPIIVLSGYLAPDTAQQCTDLGGVELMRKPFPFRELSDAVQVALQHARAGAS